MTMQMDFGSMSFASQQASFIMLCGTAAALDDVEVVSTAGCAVGDLVRLAQGLDGDGDKIEPNTKAHQVDTGVVSDLAAIYGLGDRTAVARYVASLDLCQALKGYVQPDKGTGAYLRIDTMAQLGKEQNVTVAEVAGRIAYPGPCRVVIDGFAGPGEFSSSSVTDPTWSDLQQMCDEVAAMEDPDGCIEIVHLAAAAFDGRETVLTVIVNPLS